MGGGHFFRERFPETPEEKIQYAKERGFSAEEVEAIRHIVSEEQPKRVEIGKQNKHLEGTNEMRQKEENNIKMGLPPPGEILCTLPEIQRIVSKFHGTGRPVMDSKGVFQNKERVDLPYPVGLVDGNHVTNKIMIHYSKNGTHIVPRR